MIREQGPHNFEVSPSTENRWKEFLEDSFIKHKEDLTYFILWYLNNGGNYERLTRKNENREQVVEDIVQNLYIRLLREKEDTQKKFLELDPEQQKKWIISQAKWATSSYFNYPVGGPHGTGFDYPHAKDTYINPKTSLKSLTELDKIDIEAAENSEGAWPYAKASIKIESKEANPYVLEEMRQQEEDLAINMKESLSALSPKERKVVRMRFGIRPWKNEHTLEEIGEKLSLTRSRIGQIEAKALRLLRAPSASRRLRKFVNDYKEQIHAEPQQEEKERPTHYFRWYMYDDEGSKTGKFTDSVDKAIRRAKSELTDTFGHPEFKNRTMNAVVQEVDETEEKNGKIKKKFRNIWEGSVDDIEGKVNEGVWMED